MASGAKDSGGIRGHPPPENQKTDRRGDRQALKTYLVMGQRLLLGDPRRLTEEDSKEEQRDNASKDENVGDGFHSRPLGMIRPLLCDGW